MAQRASGSNPASGQPASPNPAGDLIRRVVVKFNDDVKLPYEDGVERLFEERRIGPWNELRQQFPGITVKRLYTTLTLDQMQALIERAALHTRGAYKPPRFLSYFAVEFPPGVEPEALAAALRGWDTVELAYAEGRSEPLPSVKPKDDPRYANQGYLKKAPGGIDASFVWRKVPTGAGDGIVLVDMEQGWTLLHEDLVDAGITELPGDNARNFDHGTSVLGIVRAVDNCLGDIGVAPHARVRVVSEFRPDCSHNRADAIMTALASMNAGDIFLLESQHSPTSGFPLPLETLPAVFTQIQLGTAAGIVFVEPAGNGIQDLDLYTDPVSGQHVFNRNLPGEFQDSGAIIVASATSTVPHQRIINGTSFGCRIDCYAWGENVDTLTTDANGLDLHSYMNDFTGTSSASAIIAGAAVLVQSVAVAQGLAPFDPATLRDILSDKANGTKSAPAPFDRIRVMPNLRKILKNQFGIT
jgi:serine protease